MNDERDFKDGFGFGIKMMEKFIHGTHATHIETSLLRNFISKLKKDKWQAYLNTVAKKRRMEIDKNV